jgi:hypothetical protein
MTGSVSASHSHYDLLRIVLILHIYSADQLMRRCLEVVTFQYDDHARPFNGPCQAAGCLAAAQQAQLTLTGRLTVSSTCTVLATYNVLAALPSTALQSLQFTG